VPRSSSPVQRLLVAALVPALGLLAGCPPTCQQLCAKLDRCGFDPLVTVNECRISCERELDAYKEDDDKEGQKVFNQERRCLGAHSCDEIATGACYDEELYLFDVQ
jgi:hypothetical protein